MKKNISLIIFIFVISILFFACSPKTTDPIDSKPPRHQEVYGMDIMRFMKNTNGVNADSYIFADMKYTIVDEFWFKENIMREFNNFLFKNGVGFNDKKKNDCDDFARGFSFFSRVKSMQIKSIDYTLAVADVYYKTLDMGHAINAVIVIDNNEKWKLLFIEPQGPTIVQLDEEYKKFYVTYVGM